MVIGKEAIAFQFFETFLILCLYDEKVSSVNYKTQNFQKYFRRPKRDRVRVDNKANKGTITLLLSWKPVRISYYRLFYQVSTHMTKMKALDAVITRITFK